MLQGHIERIPKIPKQRIMKTIFKKPFELVEVEFIPETLEEGRFYHSEKFQIANHLCPCGCKQEFPVPIKPGEWQITNKDNLSISPSFLHRIHCKAHYVITNGNANILREGLPQNLWYMNYGHDLQPGE